MRIVQRRDPISNFFSYVKSFGKLNILFFAIFIAFAIAIMAQFANPKVLQNLFSDAAYDPATKTFTETFDGAPTTPQPFTNLMQDTWDIAIHSRDDNTWTTLENMESHHGPDCSPPIDASGNLVTHHNDGNYDSAVFKCKDHIMTSILAGGYGLIYLTPNAMVDFTDGEAVIKVDVTTLKTSGRDWWDIWITPFEDNIQLPFNMGDVDLQGQPKNSVHIAQINANGNGTGFAPNIVKDFVDTPDFQNNSNFNWWTGYETFMKTSPKQRTTFELRISKNHLRFGIPAGQKDEAGNLINGGNAFWWVDSDISPLTWTKGVVQFGHHSYNPQKDCTVNPNMKECYPNTWHWDNVSISPAIPFTIIKADKRMVNSDGDTVTFNQPAPANAYLRFSAIGRIEVSFDNGSTYTQTTPAPSQGTVGITGYHDEHLSSYWVPIPEGVKSVKFKFTKKDWYQGPYQAKDFTIWSANTPNGTPSNPTPTSTGSVPTPTTPPVQPTATNAPTPTSTPIPTPTPTKVASKDAIITLQPKTKDVVSGQTLTMDIMIDTTGKSINAAEATISFPPSLLTNASVSIDKTIFPIETGQNITNGTITISAASSTPRSGIVRLATISFKTASQGTANVNFSNVAIIESATNQDVFGSAQNGTYQILPQATPTPTKAQPTPTKAPAPTPSVKSSDLNGDGKVDIQDLSLLLTYRKNKDLRGDLNNDGKVNMTDVSILVKNWS